MSRAIVLAVSCLLFGVTTEVGMAALGGTAEAWHHAQYWWLGYPLLGVTAGVVGYLAPAQPWRWPLLLLAGQLLAMFLRNPTTGLLPVAVVFTGILAPPLLIPGYLGALLRRRARAEMAAVEVPPLGNC